MTNRFNRSDGNFAQVGSSDLGGSFSSSQLVSALLSMVPNAISGSATGTYNTPTQGGDLPILIKVTLTGTGAGGSSGGSSTAGGTSGSTATFGGASFLATGGGNASVTSTINGGNGNTASRSQPVLQPLYEGERPLSARSDDISGKVLMLK
jgi:hypothetical protein